eukprot:3401665-Prymnesium_polylepis.1
MPFRLAENGVRWTRAILSRQSPPQGLAPPRTFLPLRSPGSSFTSVAAAEKESAPAERPDRN